MAYTGRGIVATFKVKYDGQDVIDYRNKHGSVARDDVLAQLLPKTVCPCSIARAVDAAGSDTCLREDIVAGLAKSEKIDAGGPGVVAKLRQKTGCDGDACLLKRATAARVITEAEAGIEAQLALKQSGPTDASLFNDTVIQSQLYAWMYQFPEFYAYNFNMLNWRAKSLREGRVVARPDTLATISWVRLLGGSEIPRPVGMSDTPASRAMMAARRVRCGACIINSDEYDGNGKHWMALFVDARDTSDAPRWTVEFFNSAALRPESEWLDWMVKTKRELQSVNPRAQIEQVCVCRIWHQHSKSECGPYSVFYVWARLKGIPARYFMENVVPDQIMFEFRQHLFADTTGAQFDFDEFARKVRVKWDTEDIGASDGAKRTNM